MWAIGLEAAANFPGGPTPGTHVDVSPDMEDDALIEAAATAAAAGIESLETAAWAGLLLIPYEPVHALVWGIPAEPGADFEFDTGTAEELGFLPDPASAAWEQVKARIDDGDDDGLYEPFYLALASRIRAVTGLRTLVYDAGIGMSYDEQVAREEGATENAADLLRRLDVLVSLQVDEMRVAVVYRDAQGVWSSGRYGYEDPEPLGRWRDLGSNPAVLAGRIPLGAATVNLRVSAPGPWMQPDALNRGAWICALDTRELRRAPQLRYLDAEGAEFAVEVPFEQPEPPQLWPVQAPSPGRLVSHSHGSGNTVEGGDWEVEISTVGPGAGATETPGEFLAWRGIRVDPARLPSRPIAGSVLGHRHGFELAAPSGIWVAIADCGGVQLVVRGVGEPPTRLDLELLEPDEHQN
jgi:hypothetical protein